MTRVIDETLTRHPQAVYIGEDVEHGGYYLVSDTLKKKFPERVRDFPPEETSLLGVAMGYSQVGLLPIVEIPYAKYLDCGADMFFEAAIMNWLSQGRQPNGMIVRLQGFGKGIFGGNFHTHNALHLPPGLDVVCYSNGPDYARGFRYAVQQALSGRVVMSVDCTALLNLRHVHGADDAWQFDPTPDGEVVPWEFLRVYVGGAGGTTVPQVAAEHPEVGGDLAIVSYGNGVIASLQAQKALEEHLGIHVTVVDCPYLSSPPTQLGELLQRHQRVVFVDECRQGQHPMAGHITALQSQGALPAQWTNVASMPTYNPLGTDVTFVSRDDVIEACVQLMKA